MAFLSFMSSGAGRLTRIVAGIGLIVAGALLGGGWLVLIAVGAVPLAAGVFDFCLFAPLARRPFRGPEFRRTAGS
ncbi:MAG TPA: YgaP-like transmembrane domain [Acidimicrobiales bacterium]|nr:YgaP-like transmembrane domain [Acidimicrobiales bacterium]